MKYYRSDPVIICAKDAALITGRGLETARRYLRRIRKQLGKSPGHFITIREFCDFTGIAEADVQAHFRQR